MIKDVLHMSEMEYTIYKVLSFHLFQPIPKRLLKSTAKITNSACQTF